jgi:hypothetical protein
MWDKSGLLEINSRYINVFLICQAMGEQVKWLALWSNEFIIGKRQVI